jgi:hypothetical protein
METIIKFVKRRDHHVEKMVPLFENLKKEVFVMNGEDDEMLSLSAP